MKKVVGLFSFVAISGVVGVLACSSTTTTTSSGSPDASTDALTNETGTKKEAGAATCPTDVAGQKSAIVAAMTKDLGAFKVSAPATGQCTVPQLKKLETDLSAAADVTWDQIATMLGGACGACAVTDKTAATWGAIIKLTTDTAIINQSGSYSAQGMSKACSESLFSLDYCAELACQDCADADFDACVEQAGGQDGGCAAEFASDIQANCSDADQKVETDSFNAAKAAGLELVIGYAIYNACGPKIGTGANDAGGGG